MLTERDPGRRLEEFDCVHDHAADTEIGADNPLDNIVLAESYQLFGLLPQRLDIGVGCRDIGLGLLPQRLDIGVGGEVAFQQPDTLTHHGFSLGFRHAGLHQFLDVLVSVENER